MGRCDSASGTKTAAPELLWRSCGRSRRAPQVLIAHFCGPAFGSSTDLVSLRPPAPVYTERRTGDERGALVEIDPVDHVADPAHASQGMSFSQLTV